MSNRAQDVLAFVGVLLVLAALEVWVKWQLRSQARRYADLADMRLRDGPNFREFVQEMRRDGRL